MLFLILPCFMLSITDANRLSTFCDNSSSNYKLNRAFESNLNQLLQSIPSRTSETGFYNKSIGDAPNSVYGQALCRGDVTPTVCQNCLENASQEIQNTCKSKVGIIWYKSCSIYYSNRNFFTMMEYIGKYPGSDYQRKNVSSPGLFKKALPYLMNNLAIEASSTKRMFAAGVKFSKSMPIYGLVQCTRDITNSDCKGCLGSAPKDLSACCDAREGGFVVSRNCNVRFELYPFYNYETSTGGKGKIPMVVAVTCIPVFVIAVLIGSSYVVCRRWKKGAQKDEERREHAFLQELARPAAATLTQKGDFMSSDELPFMHLDIIKAATDDFSDANKIGQGGFGAVYKGFLSDGKEVAAKRLSRRSRQGLEEFKNEIILISKLQHRNLVRLLGCSIEGEEKLLIYEFTPNKSLDIFIFDSKRRSQLNWKICYNIINGVARGLLYLHEDSQT